jgi:hypothetical protein
MTNIREITDSLGELHIEIDNGNGSFTCMPKTTYDAQIGAQDTLPSKLAEKPSV